MRLFITIISILAVYVCLCLLQFVLATCAHFLAFIIGLGNLVLVSFLETCAHFLVRFLMTCAYFLAFIIVLGILVLVFLSGYALVNNVDKHTTDNVEEKLRERRIAKGDKLTLYHQTSPENAAAIRRDGRMLRGNSGLAGGGIYFATSKQATEGKAHRSGAIIAATVKLGNVKTIYSSDSSITFARLNREGYDSVKVVRPGGDFYDEFVVYNYDQVKVVTTDNVEARG